MKYIFVLQNASGDLSSIAFCQDIFASSVVVTCLAFWDNNRIFILNIPSLQDNLCNGYEYILEREGYCITT